MGLTEPMEVAVEDAVVLGEVRNHRSQTRMMTVRHAERGEVAATQPVGTVVWSMSICGAPSLRRVAVEVDVYANGKYQTMFGLPSGLHMIDVKGREVNGFPLAPAAGLWTVGHRCGLRRQPEVPILVRDGRVRIG